MKFLIIQHIISSVDREAVAVGIVCLAFLGLFVVAGIRDIIRRGKDD